MRRGIATVLVAFSAIFAVSGCSGDNAGDGAENKGTLPGHYEVGTVNINGRDVTCVSMKQGIGDTSWGGMACDFTGALDDRP